MNVIVDNRLVSYDDIGKKGSKTILFIHGWADSSATFKQLAASLAGKYRCISVDLPGFGSSQTPESAWNMHDFSDFIVKFLKKIQVKPYALVGHSNGGAIAVNAISSGSVAPDKLVLLASSGIRSGRKLKKTFYKFAAKPVKAGLSILPENKKRSLKKKLYSRIGSDYMVAENMKDVFKNIVAYDIAGEASALKLSTLLIYGEDDDATPPEIGEKLHGLIKGSDFVMINGAGHFLHHDKPDEVGKLIKDFLR